VVVVGSQTKTGAAGSLESRMSSAGLGALILSGLGSVRGSGGGSGSGSGSENGSGVAATGIASTSASASTNAAAAIASKTATASTTTTLNQPGIFEGAAHRHVCRSVSTSWTAARMGLGLGLVVFFERLVS